MAGREQRKAGVIVERRESKKPGMMLYHDEVHALETLPPEDFKEVILALAYLSETGNIRPPASPNAAFAYTFLHQRVIRDTERYKEKCAINRDNRLKQKERSCTTVNESIRPCTTDNRGKQPPAIEGEFY